MKFLLAKSWGLSGIIEKDPRPTSHFSAKAICCMPIHEYNRQTNHKSFIIYRYFLDLSQNSYVLFSILFERT